VKRQWLSLTAIISSSMSEQDRELNMHAFGTSFLRVAFTTQYMSMVRA
jgi:hypothetical protein